MPQSVTARLPTSEELDAYAHEQWEEKVLERAKRAKEQAAREALEAQRLIPKSTSLSTSMGSGATANNGAAAKASPSTANNGVSTTPSSYNPANAAAANTDPGPDAKKE